MANGSNSQSINNLTLVYTLVSNDYQSEAESMLRKGMSRKYLICGLRFFVHDEAERTSS